jgi:hypothetical protein
MAMRTTWWWMMWMWFGCAFFTLKVECILPKKMKMHDHAAKNGGISYIDIILDNDSWSPLICI